MRFINKKVIVSILMVIEICSLFLMYKSFNNKNTVLDDVILKESNEVKNKGFAIMVEGSNGEYTESSSNTFPTNMSYNDELSGCIDIRGNKIDNALSFENNMVTLNTNTTAYCYLYFDIKLIPIRDKVIDDYTNNKGVSLLSETSSDAYPVYYYTGNITNNNIIYADYCWKMVRTTDTGGVKLIFNGAVTDGSCNNTGDATSIGNSSFNGYSSLAYAGYMYNTIETIAINRISSKAEYVYGNSVIWDGSSYTLVDTVTGGSDLTDSINNHRYTCFDSKGKCNTVWYILYFKSVIFFTYIYLSDGKNVDDYINEMLYADDVNTINSTIKTKIDSWYESYIKEKTDDNGKLYSSYLENTIFCNNRAITSLRVFKQNEGSVKNSGPIQFSYNSLSCENKTDQFTLKESAGGTAGYGNNALDYPIGLLTYKEASLATASGYLDNKSSYWLMSPTLFNYSSVDSFSDNCLYVGYVNAGRLSSISISSKNASNTFGVRPAVSLSSMVKIKGGVGDGSVDSPYEVILP